MIVVPTTDEGIAQAAQVVRDGGIIVYPTETVYGLGCDPFNECAVEALFAIKARERGKPLLLIVADEEQLKQVVDSVSARAAACMAEYWPGPLSLVFPRHPRVPKMLTGGLDTVCVRQPGCVAARALCNAVGGPVISTSANLSGNTPARSLEALEVAGIDLAIDGGTLDTLPPSTIYDPDHGHVLRVGAITLSDTYLYQ